MPMMAIGVVDSIENPEIERLLDAKWVVSFDGCDRSRWCRANVIAPRTGEVIVRRDEGVAIVAARGVDVDKVMDACAEVPDPLLVLVTDANLSPPMIDRLGQARADVLHLVESHNLDNTAPARTVVADPSAGLALRIEAENTVTSRLLTHEILTWPTEWAPKKTGKAKGKASTKVPRKPVKVEGTKVKPAE